ncbi:hypothetical protein KP509_09G085900 [Ceratopteris richardii]|uniref:Uncharacterized protein n=1 Tax=Ceratopteris richardii TaxID=49495 RepID=A0A8T2UCF0_CERRI|nr:hypothetical protein KP509_09G085900 [Ceratopteris richardii]
MWLHLVKKKKKHLESSNISFIQPYIWFKKNQKTQIFHLYSLFSMK